jgi:UDP-N-acetylglucosamine:LPS N-acetylglucosamine transferase
MLSQWDVPPRPGEDWKGAETVLRFHTEFAGPDKGAAGVLPKLGEGLEREERKAAGTMTPATRARLSFVYFDAGGGHRSAARALTAAAQEQRSPWEIECLNLQELLDPLDIVKRLAGLRVQDVYNYMLEKGWTLGAAQLLPLLHGAIRCRHSLIVKFLTRYWRDTRPDLVVSLIPNFNRALAESVRLSLPNVPFVTVLTDLADYPPHFWIEPETEYLIVGTAYAAEQAYSMEHSPEHVFLTSGMIIHPSFYSIPEADCRQQRESAGLQPNRLTGLVMFGGQGSRAMLEIARRLNEVDGLQLIFIAGRNKELEADLRRMSFRIPVHIQGFTSEMPRFMQMSDFFIGKPGPGSLSEALFMGLPVIVERNAWTLPQERFNTHWVVEKEVGIVVRSFRDIRKAVERLRTPAVFRRYRSNTQQLRNRAVYEVITILENILARRKGESQPCEPLGK